MKVFITFIMCLVAVSCGGGSNQPSKQLSPIEKALQTPIGSVVTSDKTFQVTPLGTLVYSETGVTWKQLEEIDKGVVNLHTAKNLDGFKERLKIEPSDIEIFIPPIQCENGSFLLNAGTSYDGSIYDKYNPKGEGVKDGKSVITAAEKVLSYGSPDGSNAKLYVCPEVLALGVQYGLEHVFLYRYGYINENRDKPPYDGQNYFVGSQNHSGGISHPLLPRDGRLVPRDGRLVN